LRRAETRFGTVAYQEEKLGMPINAKACMDLFGSHRAHQQQRKRLAEELVAKSAKDLQAMLSILSE
jgi:hypothetical protein